MMHPDLAMAFDKLVQVLQADPRCKGGWHYGSVGRGEQDEYSDYDPVFLVDDKDFESLAGDVPRFMASICDELLICWPENYNDAHFKNFCNILRMGKNLHQHDFFILNAGYPMTWFCRQHLKGCTRENIIFDRTGEVGILLDKGLRTDNNSPDVARAMDTYWFHVEMLIKYFKRRDMLKLLRNIDFLRQAHVDVLLAQYDTLDWGAWETKVKKCVPREKQAHLLAYYAAADFAALDCTLRLAMQHFQQDARDACTQKGIAYPEHVTRIVAEYYSRRMNAADASGWE